MEKSKKILFKSMSIILSVAMLSMGLLTLNNNGIIKLENQKEKPEALTSEMLPKIKTISTSGSHSIAIDINGNLWSWGYNKYGQLGNGTTEDSGTPIQIMPENNFKEIATGNNCSIAIDSDGKLWTWGRNNYGQLGNETTEDSSIPIMIMTEKTFIEISRNESCGSYNRGDHWLAIDSDGKLWAWGRNNYGQLGNETTENSSTPIQIMPENNFKDIVTGNEFSIAIDNDGKLWTWGRNGNGQLGNGTTEDSSIPIKVMPEKHFVKIVFGYYYCLAIDSEGKLWTWGRNNAGQLGNGTMTNSSEPIQIMEETTFKEISAGYDHTIAIDSEGKLWTWGDNNYGQLGNGTMTNSREPIQIMEETTFKEISAGYDHTIAIDSDGNLWTWGRNNYGQLGNEMTESSSIPIQIMSGNNFKEIVTGDYYSMAIDTKGKLWTWGYNKYGQLGTGNTVASSREPIQIMKETTFKEISAGYKHNIAIDSEGNLWTWGYNDHGQLGNGTRQDSYIPIQVMLETRFSQIAAGLSYSLAIDSEGKLWTWGDNNYGQLGDGTTDNSSEPIQIMPETSFTQIAVGNCHSMAIDSEGKLWTWGRNNAGQLGNGTTTDSNTPIQIMKEKTFTQISAGDEHSIAMDSEGKLWAWGYNVRGQLGNGKNGWNSGADYDRELNPVEISTETEIEKISAGNEGTMFMDKQGKIWVSGSRYYDLSYSVPTLILENMQFKEISESFSTYLYFAAIDKDGGLWTWGDFKTTSRINENKIETNLMEGTKFKKVSVGYEHGITIDENGKLWTWGYNDYGQLGVKIYCDVPTMITENVEEYTVTFKNGEEIIDTQTVENGADAVPPNLTKDGYTLAWDTDYTNIIEDKTITAIWTPNTDTTYRVEYYKQKLDKSGYELAETVPLTGTTEETVNATIKAYPGFTENTTHTERKVSGEILGDGSLVLKVFYDRNTYKLTINVDGETEEIEYTYGEQITLPTDKTKEGYTFEGWYNNEDLTGEKVTTIDTTTIDPAGTQPTYYIKWTANEGVTYTVEYYKQKVDKTGYELAETIPLTGTTEETVNATIKTYPGFTENTTYEERKVSGEILGDGSLVLKVFYDRNTYTLTINIDGETEEIEYTYGEQITLPTDKTKEGYTFEGWYNNEDLTGDKVTTIDTSTIDPAGTQPTYYIKWTANEGVTYTVEYYKQKVDKTGYELAETIPLTGTTEETVNATIKTYPGFTENTTHEERKVSGEILGDGSLVLKVFYDRNTYTLTINIDGETEEIEYTYGEQITLPTDFTKEGYTFEGWYANEDLTGEKVTVIDTTTIDPTGTQPTYYIKWTPNEGVAYTVEYYKQKLDKTGYELAETVPLTGTTEETVNATIKTYPGFTENTTHEERKVTGEILGDGSLVLKVFYDRNTYKLTINIDGETEEIEYTYGEQITLPTDKTKEGYTFEGWYNNEDLTGDKVTTIDTSTIDPDGTQPTYYIKWTANEGVTYTVEYYKQKLDKTGYELAETVPLTGTTEETVNATIKAYPGFTENTTHTERKVSGEILGDGSLVLKVFYNRIRYTLTIEIEDDTRTIEYIYGEEIELPTDFTKEGYTFEGWYDNENFEGEPLGKIDTTTIDENTVFYPKWTRNTFTVTFKDGEKEETRTVNQGETVTAPNWTKAGYTLTWDKDLNNITENTTITAIWVEREDTPYKVEYYLRSTDSEVETYTLAETIPLTGTTGETVNAEIKEYPGFEENTTYAERKVSGIIAGDGSLTLKVYYTRNTYEVTLNTNKGIITSGNIDKYTYGIEMVLPTRITREGFTFRGWYNNAECTGEAVTKITSTDIEAKTYYAKWEGNPNIPYTVEYYGQKLESEEYELLETVPLTGTAGTLATAPVKEITGFTENAEYVDRVPSGEIEGDGSLVLKLYYTRNTYKITLNLEDETREIEYTYGETVTLPTDIVKEGYVFVGWYDNEELTGNPITQITPEDAEDKTFYIKWATEDEYYITSEVYSLDFENNYITKVSPNITITTFINNITTNGTKKVVNAKGEDVNTESLVGTGYKLQVTYKGIVHEYEIAVRGDVDGNGEVTVTDLSMVNQSIVQSLTLTGVKKIAADTDYNGEITVTDLSMVNQAITGKTKL